MEVTNCRVALGLPVKLNTFHNCTGVDTNQIQPSPRAVGTVGAIGRPQTSAGHLLFPCKPDAYFPATWPTARSQKVRRVRRQARVLPVALLCQLHSARWPRVPMQTDGSYLSYQTVTWCGTAGLWALGQGVCVSVLVCAGVCVGCACIYAGVYTHVCWYAHMCTEGRGGYRRTASFTPCITSIHPPGDGNMSCELLPPINLSFACFSAFKL